MTMMTEVKREIVLELEHGPGFCNEQKIILSGDLSETEVVAAAAKICGRIVRTLGGPVHPQCTFVASKRYAALFEGKKLVSPLEDFIPFSHFGEAEPMSPAEIKKANGHFNFVAKTITKQTKRLAPGDRVYGLDGTLRFTAPAIKKLAA